MKVSISKSSWHVTIYKWLYNTKRLPQSLCPYFWKVVLACILAPFIVLLSIPAYISNMIISGWVHARKSILDLGIRNCLLMGTGIWICIILFIGLVKHILFLAGIYSTPHGLEFGMSLLIICVMIGIFINDIWNDRRKVAEDKRFKDYLANHPEKCYYDFVREVMLQKRKRWYECFNPGKWLVVVYIIATIKNICPIIEWKS